MTKKQSHKIPKYTIEKYTVVQVEHEDATEKLFECVSDRWFVDETKTACFWPPPNGKPFSVRAINCEKPDDSWNVYECRVISEGHLTYNSGFKIVKEKCSQKYNTSSADEHINAAIYKRKHPVLAMQNDGDIENIFAKRNPTLKIGSQNKQQKNVKTSSKKSSENNSSSVKISGSSCSVPSSIAGPMDTSTMNADIRNKNVHSESSVRDGSVNAVSLDCENENTFFESEVYVNGEPESTVTPKNTSDDIGISVTEAAGVRNSNQSSTTPTRSDRSRSSRSHSIRSRESSSYRSQSIRSESNVSRMSRSDSNDSRRNHSNRDQSSETIRYDSIMSANNKSPQMQKHKENKSKTDSIPKNSRNKRVIKSSCSESNAKNKSSSSGLASELPQSRRSCSAQTISSRSRSKPTPLRSLSNSNSFRSHSRSRTPGSGYGATNYQKSNNKKEQSHGRSRETHGRKTLNAMNSSVLEGKNKRRRSLEPKFESHAKCSRKSSHRSRSRIQRRRSSSEYSRSGSRRSFTSKSPQQSQSNGIYNYDYSRRNYPESQSTREKTTQSNRDKNSQSTREKNPQSTIEKNYRATSSKVNSTAGAVTVQDLMKAVGEMKETIRQNNQQLKDNDRRLHRMEVTVNKIFVLVGDLNGNVGTLQDELLNDQGFEIPDLPISNTNELLLMHRKLKNKEFWNFFVQREKDFCCPTRHSTDTVTISKYLKRFISLRVRTKLTLKEPGDNGITLYNHYHKVYLFLIDVMMAGYRSCKKTITKDDAHTALRIVWGRSKQLFRETGPNRK